MYILRDIHYNFLVHDIVEWMDGSMDGSIDGSMDGWIGKWMDG